MVKISNLNMKDEIVFDNENYVLNEKDLGKAEIDLATFQGYSQIGSQVSGRTIGSRDIAIVGFALADSDEEMLKKKRRLQRLVNPSEDFFLIIGDYRLRVSATSTVEYAVKYEENNRFLCKFLIEGVATNPCFERLTATHMPVALWIPHFHFPLNIDQEKKIVMGARKPSMIMKFFNEGEVPTGMIVTIRSKVNGVKNPYILDMDNQQKLTVDCTLNRGDVLKINTSYGEKSVILNDTTDYFYLVDLDSDFVQMKVGENHFRFGAATNENNIDVDVDFFPQYFEV